MVSTLINSFKKFNFGKFFEVGSFARNEDSPNDYDIIIVPNLYNKEKWVNVLRLLGKCKVDGKKVDAQIIPFFNPDTVTAKKKYNKYIYSKDNPNKEIYTKVVDGLWKKKTGFYSEKHIVRGIDKLPIARREL